MELPDKTIRASALSGYTDCSRRAAVGMFPNAISDAGFTVARRIQNIGAAIGHGAHAALQYTLQKKIDDGTQGSDRDAESAAIDALHSDVADGVHYDKTIATSLNQAEEQVLRGSRMIRGILTPRIHPVEVEIEMTASYRGIVFTGHMDVREQRGMGDLKTGKFKRPSAPQYGAYTMLGMTRGNTVEYFNEYYLSSVPLNKPAPMPEITKYDVEKCKEVALIKLDYVIDDYYKFLEDGNPKHFRANPSSILCGPKFCQAFGTKFCTEHKGA